MSIPEFPPPKWLGYAVWIADNENGPMPPDPRMLEWKRAHRVARAVKETIVFKSRRPCHLWNLPPKRPPHDDD